MISRRNIRVKAFQVLYSFDVAGTTPTLPEIQKALRKQFDQTQGLLVYLVYFLTETARYVERLAHQRASKHLPTTQDLNVSIKLAGNTALWAILNDKSFTETAKKTKPELIIDTDLVRKLFKELEGTELYNRYINLAERDKKPEKEMLAYIFNDLMLPSESFESHVQEKFTNYDDDIEMLHTLINSYLQKPGSLPFDRPITPDKVIYAEQLVKTVYDKQEVLMDYIKPRLKNWDADRVAMVDMLLLQMGLSELLFFETIPPKVTLNEYIDIAKDYSTPQSGHFVNGILDNIHKELAEQNKLHKTDFKKSR
jgi:transcription antitermination protein NusB